MENKLTEPFPGYTDNIYFQVILAIYIPRLYSQYIFPVYTGNICILPSYTGNIYSQVILAIYILRLNWQYIFPSYTGNICIFPSYTGNKYPQVILAIYILRLCKQYTVYIFPGYTRNIKYILRLYSQYIQYSHGLYLLAIFFQVLLTIYNIISIYCTVVKISYEYCTSSVKPLFCFLL